MTIEYIKQIQDRVVRVVSLAFLKMVTTILLLLRLRDPIDSIVPVSGTSASNRAFQHRDAPAKSLSSPTMCLVLGLLAVVPLVILTPPFQVPDEAQHFARSYQLSELQLWGIVQDGRAGAILPSSIQNLTEEFLGTRAIHAVRPITLSPLRKTLLALEQPLNAEQREFIDFSGAASYSPIPYLPQAIAIALGRAGGAGPLMLLYLGRLANALTAIVVLAWAVRLTPIGREAMVIVGLLPMALYLYASVSPDAAVITAAFLFTATALRGLFHGKWATDEIVTTALSAAVFCSVKVVYAPLVLISLPAILMRRRHNLLAHGVILSVAFGITAIWLSSSSSMIVLLKPGTSLSGQAAFIAEHPISFAAVIVRSFLWNEFYLKEMIGILGWLTIQLPSIAYWLPVLALLISIGVRSPITYRLPLALAAWGTLMLAASTILIVTALYLYWTPIGEATAVGVQGRYFLPLLALGGAIVFSLIRLPESYRGFPAARWAIAFIIVIEIAITHWTIMQAYGVLM